MQENDKLANTSISADARANLSLWKSSARAANEAMDVEREIAIWQEVLRAVSDDLDAHERLAILFVSAGRSLDAMPHFNALQARAKEDRSVRKRLARASASEGLSGAKFHYVPDIYGRSARKQIDIRSDELFRKLADEARAWGRTLLYYDRLFTLYESVANLVRQTPADEPLRILEIGVYKGGSSYFLASVVRALRDGPAELLAVDTFSGHPAEDIPDGIEGSHIPGHGQFDETTFIDVRNYLSTFPSAQVMQGRIQDVAGALGWKFGLIHLDTDIYAPTHFTLEHFGAHLRTGAIVIVDDYGFVTCPGVRRAVNEYLNAHPELFLKFELQTGQCLLIRSDTDQLP